MANRKPNIPRLIRIKRVGDKVTLKIRHGEMPEVILILNARNAAMVGNAIATIRSGEKREFGDASEAIAAINQSVSV